jgi:hypothetical protein
MKVDRQYGQRLKPRSQNPGVKHIVMDDVGEVTQITCADCGRVWAYSHDEILALPAASHANGDVTRCWDCQPVAELDEPCGQCEGCRSLCADTPEAC